MIRASILMPWTTAGQGIALLVTLVLTLVSAPVAAQGRGCEWLPGTRNITSRMVGTNRVSYASTPRIRCSDGRYIQADSALQFEASGYMEFIGGVVFREDGRTLTARRAVYYENLGRLDAEGDVELVQPDGNEIRGEQLRFLRQGPQRPREELTVTGGRPSALLYPAPTSPESATATEPTAEPIANPQADSAALDTVSPDTMSVDTMSIDVAVVDSTVADASQLPDSVPGPDSVRVEDTPQSADSVRPWRVDADRIFLRGEEVFTARGDVEVTRDSLTATSDSLAYDQLSATLDLTGRPARILQGELDLSGREVRVVLPGDEIREVVARDEARLVNDSLTVDAPVIRLFMSAGQLDRMVASAPRAADEATPEEPESAARPARGTRTAARDEEAAPSVDSLPRARALGNGIDMVADSLEVVSPAQKLERMIAIGRARAVSTGRDTLNSAETPELLLHDWIEGDTVIAAFIQLPADSAGGEPSYALETLDAMRNARSLYRLDPDSAQLSDSTAFRSRLPVSYVEAEGIRLSFVDGQVSRFLYEGLRRGRQLQPVRRPDELPVVLDTIVPDTVAAPPGVGDLREDVHR